MVKDVLFKKKLLQILFNYSKIKVKFLIGENKYVYEYCKII